MQSFPPQRLSYSEKVKNDKQWAKDVVKYLIDSEDYSYYNKRSQTSDYHRKLSNYQLYNNILNQADFKQELNPMGLEVGQFEDTIQP
jgi:hypothetical protein